MKTEHAQLGYIPEPIDTRDVWIDELELGGTGDLPLHHNIDNLHYEYQGPSPYCVSFATTTAVEYKYQQLNGSAKQPHYSQPHLFHHAGGSMRGSYIRSNLNVAKNKNKGLIEYSRFPMPPEGFTWNYVLYEDQQREARSVPFSDSYKIQGYAHVTPTTERLRRAIVEHGPVIVGVYAVGDYYQNAYATRPGNKLDNHVVLITGWLADGRWVLFDSLNYVRDGGPGTNTPGYRTVREDYGFHTAYVVTELPDDWRKKRDEARTQPYEHCLNHYGKPRDFLEEQRVAAQMVEEFEKFNNRSVMEAAGRFWTVMINMVVYGGYNISYRKWGMWQPGDVINMIYQWRRTGALIFNPNLERGEEGYRNPPN